MPKQNGNSANNGNFEIDRTVPENENYYGNVPVDLNFNNRSGDRDIVRDNQDKQPDDGINPTLFNDSPENQQQNFQKSFQSETYEDFARESRSQKPDNNKREKPNKPKRSKKKKNAGKKLLIVLLAVILTVSAFTVPILIRINYDDTQDNEYISSSDLKSSILVKNILLIGVDARSDEEEESSRSDSMILVSLDMKHRCIKMISFLRDSWVYIPSQNTEQRLNAACTYGGYSGVVDTIEYNFGIDIDNYIVTDFEMFQILVDSLGGVEIEVTEAEANEVTNHPSRYGGVTLDSGKQTLTGEQALAYCRIRKIDTDFARTQRQRTVISAIISGVKGTNPLTLYKMAYNSTPYIETDMSKIGLMNFVMQAGLCATGSIVQDRVPFEDTWNYATISGNSVIRLDIEENKSRLIDFIYNKSADELQEAEE